MLGLRAASKITTHKLSFLFHNPPSGVLIRRTPGWLRMPNFSVICVP
jgi:hypothetical protein